MGIQSRLEKLEHATGINEPCEACEATDRFSSRVAKMMEGWGVKDEGGVMVESACDWCGSPRPARLVGLTRAEVSDFKRLMAMYWEGLVCDPEYERARLRVRASLERETVRRFGAARSAEVDAAAVGYRADLDRIKQAPLHYLCRVWGCECEYPKTFEEWRANMRANGFRLAA